MGESLLCPASLQHPRPGPWQGQGEGTLLPGCRSGTSPLQVLGPCPRSAWHGAHGWVQQRAHTVPSQPCTHASHMCTACTHRCSRVAVLTQPAHMCSHTHTHTPPQHSGLMLHRLPTPCPQPYPIWGAVPYAHSLLCGRGQWGAEEAGVTPSTATSSPMLPSCTYKPTPTREPGGCWEAQAPTQHHFLLSLWRRARPGRGVTAAPQDLQVVQVRAACATGKGMAEDRTWESL